jgi:hypothetical protein
MLHLQFGSSDHEEDDLGFSTMQFGKKSISTELQSLTNRKITLFIIFHVVKLWKTVSHLTVIQRALILIALL